MSDETMLDAATIQSVWYAAKMVGGTLLSVGVLFLSGFGIAKLRELKRSRSYTIQDELNDLHKTNDGIKRQAEVDLVTRLLEAVKEVSGKYDDIRNQLMELSTTHAKLEAASEYKDSRIIHLEEENLALRDRVRALEAQVAHLMQGAAVPSVPSPLDVRLVENEPDTK